MRIRLDIPSALLRRALADLLEDAGHAVDATGRPEGVGLQILSAPGVGSPWPKVATLYLRPGRSARPAKDPGEALRAALHGAGVATWSPPLDVELLLESLGVRDARRPRKPLPMPSDAPLATSPDAWLLLDPRTRDVEWTSDAARARYVVAGGVRLSQRGASAVPSAVFEREEGSEVRTVDGRPHLVSWWTAARGLRCVGLLRLPAGASGARDDNVETLAELGRVSATLAHEIRNPLASLAGALDLLAHEPDADERGDILRLARQRLDQMRRMLDDALRLARPFRGPPEAVAAADLVRSAVATVRTDGLFERVELRVESGPGLPDVLAHPEPLRQAVLNLLVNAAQAQAGKGRVTVRVESADAFGVIRVEDEGPGIPAEAREKVFAPFWTTKEGGTGLGLAYVKRVVEAAGGRALVEDVPRGACVRLELPLAEPVRAS